MAAENERLRRENALLRRSSSADSELERAQAEIAALKRKLVENAKAEVAEAAPATPAAELQPRGRGRPFDVRALRGRTSEAWEPLSQPMSQPRGSPRGSRETSADTQHQLVAVESAAPGTPAAQLVSAELQPQPAAEPTPSGGVPSWGRQCDDEVWGQLLEAQGSLEEGNEGAAKAAFGRALAAHLSDSKRPYLAFSAAVHRLFQSLQTPEPGAAPATPKKGAGLDAARERCAALVEAAIAEAAPAPRPRERSRSEHVREQTAQVGLCLDLARLACRPPRAAATPQAPAAGAPTRSRSPRPLGRSQASQDALRRAGERLASLQADMDRLRAEAKRAAEKLLLQQGSSKPKQQTVASERAPSADGVASAEEQRAPAKQEERSSGLRELLKGVPDTASEGAPAASGAGAPAASAEAPQAAAEATQQLVAVASTAAAVGRAELLDPLRSPDLGQFLEKQLLPLYVGHIPFEDLREFADAHCGIPLDSDDEREAWKESGRQAPPLASTPVMPKRRARRSKGSKGADAETNSSLGELMQVTKKPLPSLRPGMENSIVEKKGKERATPSEMKVAIPLPTKRAVIGSSVAAPGASGAAASGAGKPKPPSLMALLTTPAVKKGLRSTAPGSAASAAPAAPGSRVSVKKRSRTAADAELRQVQSPSRQPNFSLLDTPGK